MELPSGILNLDKPAGVNSARVVSIVKKLLPRGMKVGHAGTLDPFATGVLLVLVGHATRQCESLMDQPKQYLATIRLGATTKTDDPDSEPVPHPLATRPSADSIQNVLAGMIGSVKQRPPLFSALKVNGRRASDWARHGTTVDLPERIVRIDAIELLSFSWPDAVIRVDCGRGTYVRSIARDLGEALGCGGYLTELRRTRVGPFNVEQAVSPGVLSEPFLRSHLRATIA